MVRKSLCLGAMVVAAAGVSLATTAHAQDTGFSGGYVGGPSPGGDRIGDWKIGALAYMTAGTPEPTVSDLHTKVRIGSSLVPQLGGFAEVRPFVALGPTSADGSLHGLGGILIDVPLGSFVFTPSISAGTLPRTPRDQNGAVEFRSQLEVGYEFENKSRFSLGYSRIDSSGAPMESGSTTNNVFGLYYRLPFGALSRQ